MKYSYYNEFDPFAAEWLRQLIKEGVIADGVVDGRSILDVSAEDVKSFAQVHCFAGIGVWSYALRQAGWPDDRQVWSGSPPCQGFSAAGKRKGFEDERHLWPTWFRLIEQCRPRYIFGEQVSSSLVVGSATKKPHNADVDTAIIDDDGETTWWDTVQKDLEGASYASTAFDLSAPLVGAPHIRQRLYFHATRLANDEREGPQGRVHRRESQGRHLVNGRAGRDGAVDWVADSDADGWSEGRASLASTWVHGVERDCLPDGLANPAVLRCESEQDEQTAGILGEALQPSWQRLKSGDMGAASWSGLDDNQGERRGVCHSEQVNPSDGEDQARPSCTDTPCPTNGFWTNPDWLLCKDGKFRPTQPGIEPVVDGAAKGLGSMRNTSVARTPRLKGYGNAIVAPLAIVFVEAAIEHLEGGPANHED